MYPQGTVNQTHISPASATKVAGIIGMYHDFQLKNCLLKPVS
jgi:hypothetical protein